MGAMQQQHQLGAMMRGGPPPPQGQGMMAGGTIRSPRSKNMFERNNRNLPGQMIQRAFGGAGAGMNMTPTKTNGGTLHAAAMAKSGVTAGEKISPYSKFNKAQIKKELTVPQRHISRLIGREGKNIKQLKVRFDCNIRIFDSSESENV